MLKQPSKKKKKDKINEATIVDNIPEAPNLSDFEIITQNELSYKIKIAKNEPIAKEILKDLPNSFKEHEDNLIEKNLLDSELKSDPEILNFEENIIINDKILEKINFKETAIHNSKIDSKQKGMCNDRYLENETKDVTNNDSFPNQYSYSTLSNAIEALTINLEEASAPKDEHYCNNLANFKCMNSTKHFLDIKKYSFSMILKDTVTPFSDEELSNFYINPELQNYKIHNNRINNEIIDLNKQDNYFYKLMVEYIQSKTQLKNCKEKIKELKLRLNACTSELWTVWDDIKIENKTCRDGNIVSHTQKFTQAQFNPNIYNEFTHLLKELKCAAYENFLKESFTSSFLQIKIEFYLQNLMFSCHEFTNLDENLVKIIDSKDSYFQECLQHLKETISILFFFQRKENFDVDESFIIESRKWLSNLVSILIRVGSLKEHIFLFQHILRCSGGVSEWAIPFIQLPTSLVSVNPFNNEHINHIITILHIFFSPIDKNENPDCIQDTLVTDSNPWILVDSDGEIEDDINNKSFFFLKENDLMSILNQIPFEYLFREIFQCRASEIIFESQIFNYLLKLFSFSTDLIKIILNGVKLYNSKRYKQFNKRLGQLICHIVHYVTEVFIKYKSEKIGSKELIRIQTEYDSFFFKSIKALYSAKKHGPWQFLVTMPYHMISPTTTLKIYALLQLNDLQEESLLSVNFINFEEKFLQLPEEEQYYLLNTITNIALARDISEIELIKNILLQLFYIGFVGSQTLDSFYKNVKYLLCSICTRHSFLISEILAAQNQLFVTSPVYDERLSIYLWLNLPLDIWKPKDEDLEIISDWLLEPLNTLRSELSRIILQSLNYGICEGKLFLSVKTHRAIAFMLMQASLKSLKENEQGFIKNMSSIVYSQCSLEQSAADWTWAVLLKLRLHLLDKPQAFFYKYLNNLLEHLANIPAIDSNIELHNLILKKYPIACFVALMTTTLGHSVPVMIEQGFELVEVILNNEKYNPAIVCIEFMTILFLECSDSLYTCEKFISVLSQLIAVENTYVQKAKNLISINDPGPILKSLEYMIQTQLNSCRICSLNKFNECIKLWMMSLSKIPSWTEEPGVLFLMDMILQNAFFNYSSTQLITNILENLWEENKSSNETKSSLSSLLAWINVKFIMPSWLPKGLNGNIPWLSYLIIQIEFDTFERKNQVWVELLKELFKTRDKKADIDSSLKKVCNLLGYSVRPSSSLAIYKWIQQILNTNIHHPLVPLMWQKFFFLYFYRAFGSTDCGSLGRKFFDGVVNQRLFKQLNERLTESIDRINDLSNQTEQIEEKNYYLKCYGLFQTYSLWLNDPKLHEPYLNINFLSPEYNAELFGLIIHGSDAPWIEFTPYRQIEQISQKHGEKWLELKGRTKNKKISRSNSLQVEKLEKGKLSERLKCYESPLPPPGLPNFDKKNFPNIMPKDLMDDLKINNFLKPFTEKLMAYRDQYTFFINQNLSISFDLQELSTKLYGKTISQKILKKECLGTSNFVKGEMARSLCSGPANFNFKFEEWKTNEKVQRQFDQCKKAFDENIQKNLSQLPTWLIMSVVTIDAVIEELKKNYILFSKCSEDDESKKKLKKIGTNLFYEFVHVENMVKIPPLERAFDRFINILGKTFLENNDAETEELLHHILNNDEMETRLLNYFSPNTVTTLQDFVKHYSTTLECKSSEKLLTILSKFDLVRFLYENEPKFSVRSSLISAIGRGLISCSKGPTKNDNIIQMLNAHLEILLKYDFPEHYGEVLNFLLETSRDQIICSSTWYFFLNSLIRDSNFSLKSKQPIKKLKQHFIKSASDLEVPLDVVRGTIIMLASYFKKERTIVGMQGLHGKYNNYTEPLFIFFGMLNYSLIAKTLELDSGSLAEKLTQLFWPLLSDLFIPWLVPYRSPTDILLKEDIKSNEFDASINLPWTSNDVSSAILCTSIFTESIRFILDTLPGFNNVLNHLWSFYVTHFAQIHVKDFVLNVLHDSFLSLPWETFFPTFQDVEWMVQIVNQYLPFSHNFLGNIFIKINWTQLIEYYTDSCREDTAARFHVCLLNLLVKLPMEPSLKQNDKILNLLNEAVDYSWHLIDAASYEVILNWFVMSCDPRIILMDEKLDYFKLDSAIFRLLKTCCGLSKTIKQLHLTSLTKRSLFIKACVNWLISSSKRFKYKESPLIKDALIRIWEDVNFVGNEVLDISPPLRSDEFSILFGEFLLIFSESEISFLMEDVICEWLSKPQSKTTIFGLLRTTASTVDNPNQFGRITEASLENYFSFIEDSNWSEIIQNLQIYTKTKTQIDKILIEKKYFLTLYASLIKTVDTEKSRHGIKLVLTDLLHILSEEKLNFSVEPKLLLLIIFSLNIINSEINLNGKQGISLLVRLFNVLKEFVDDKGLGFLSAVGLKKPSFSNKYKLICCCVCGGIVIFFNKKYPESLADIDGDKVLQILNTESKIFQSIIQYFTYAKNAVDNVETIKDIVKIVKDVGLKLFSAFYLKELT